MLLRAILRYNRDDVSDEVRDEILKILGDVCDFHKNITYKMRMIPGSTTVIIKINPDNLIHFCFADALESDVLSNSNGLFNRTILIAFFNGISISRLSSPAFYRIEGRQIEYAKLIINSEICNLDEFIVLMNNYNVDVSYHTYTLLDLLSTYK